MVFEITNLLVGLNMAEYNIVDLYWKTDQQKMSKLKHGKETRQNTNRKTHLSMCVGHNQNI